MLFRRRRLRRQKQSRSRAAATVVGATEIAVALVVRHALVRLADTLASATCLTAADRGAVGISFLADRFLEPQIEPELAQWGEMAAVVWDGGNNMAGGSNPQNVQAPNAGGLRPGNNIADQPYRQPTIGFNGYKTPQEAEAAAMPDEARQALQRRFYSLPPGWQGVREGTPDARRPRAGGAPATAPSTGQPNVFQQSSNAYTQALQGTSAAGAYQPQNVQATQVGTQFGYTPQNVQASQVGTQFGYTPQNVRAGTAAGGINTYMNPYTQQVIDTSMADLERQRQMQQNQLGAQASAAGAFGGSRQGIAEAETNRAFAQQGGQLAAQLRQQGFNTALGASQQDVANQMQAGIANQNAGARATEFGQNLGFQGQQANQNAGLQAGIANQGAGLQAANLGLNAASQLGNLSQQGFNMGQAINQQQQQFGTMQQAINQALIDAARGQYAGFTGAPGQSLGAMLGALGGANMGQQTSTQTQQPGLFNYLSLGLGALSDIRLKDDIKPAGEIGGVRFYTWNWNETGKRLADPKQPTFGVIADEVAVSHPQHVARGADGYLRVNYAGLIGELRAA